LNRRSEKPVNRRGVLAPGQGERNRNIGSAVRQVRTKHLDGGPANTGEADSSSAVHVIIDVAECFRQHPDPATIFSEPKGLHTCLPNLRTVAAGSVDERRHRTTITDSRQDSSEFVKSTRWILAPLGDLPLQSDALPDNRVNTNRVDVRAVEAVKLSVDTEFSAVVTVAR
jgi:hypothetical protein